VHKRIYVVILLGLLGFLGCRREMATDGLIADLKSAHTADTLVDVFLNAVEHDCRQLMLYKEDGKWKSISSRELYRRVSGVARGLLACGVQRGDRVAILSENRPEWAIADFATLMIGAVTVPIYPTVTAEQCEYVLRNSDTKVIFVSSSVLLKKILDIRAQTQLERIIVMDQTLRIEEAEDVLWIGDLYRNGSSQRDPEFEARARETTPLTLATLIYTSGTTGVPKGVMITHGNLASNMAVSFELFNIKPGMICISFLPLAHIVARHVDIGLLNRGCTREFREMLPLLKKFQSS